MTISTFQVMPVLSWCNAGMLVFVDNGFIIGTQQNPTNGLTYSNYPEEIFGTIPFNPEEYLWVKQVKNKTEIKNSKDFHKEFLVLKNKLERI